MIGFEDACLDSSAGTALLATLEFSVRDDAGWLNTPTDSIPAAVEKATTAVQSMTFGVLCSAAVSTASHGVGPWIGDAAEFAAAAYRCAERRRPIAAAIAERFDAELHSPMDPAGQQWWNSAERTDEVVDAPRRFENYDRVYGNGEFTWAGMWTVTNPPPEVHDNLIDVWEMFPWPISRWHLPVRPDSRVHEVHRPEDWVALVEAHPFRASRGAHGGWELPGPNQHIDRSGLLEIPNQRAAAVEVSAHLLPDWTGVAGSFDAVHLSWAGFITTEGCITDMGGGAVTMLRYWGSERTLWLHDCFTEPEPLDAPVLSGRINGDIGIGCLADEPRRASDRAFLGQLLGR